MIFFKKKTIRSYQMGWRYVLYREGVSAISFSIEPMIKHGDLVYIPSESAWQRQVRGVFKKKRKVILNFLKEIKWNRELIWQESEYAIATEISGDHLTSVKGSLESTPGGAYLENLRLFHPGQKFSFEQVRSMWIEVDKKFTSQAKGNVKIFCSELIPDSVFAEIELPGLKANKDVILDIIK